MFRFEALFVGVIITTSLAVAAGDELRTVSDAVQRDWPAFRDETFKTNK